MEADIFSSGCIAVAGEFHWDKGKLARETQGGQESLQSSGERAYGASMSWAWRLGWNLWDQKGSAVLPWCGLTTGFLEENSRLRVQWDDVGELSLKKEADQQFLEGIVDLAEVWVTSSGLGSVVPMQLILAQSTLRTLVYSLPQTVLWGRIGSEAPLGLCQGTPPVSLGFFFFFCLSKQFIYLFI